MGRSALSATPAATDDEPVFVRYYLEVPLPFAEAEATLVREPEAWVPRLAQDAQARGERLLSEVGFGANGRRVGKVVEIQFGEAVTVATKTIVPMQWHAAGADVLFPTLEADLEVAALGPNRSQFAITARYTPPLGALGRAVDRALLHRVAEATIKDFMDEAGRALASRAARPSPDPMGPVPSTTGEGRADR